MPGIAAPSKTAPADTRERILRAAAEAWHASSYDGVGVAELCRLAGVHKGSFFHFFSSKEDLLLAVLERHAREVREWTIEGPFCPDVTPLARFERFFAAVASAARDAFARTGGFHGCPIGNVSVELATRHPAVRAAAARVFDAMHDVFVRTLRDAVAHGELAPALDVDAAARAVIAYFQGLAVLGKTYADVGKLEGLARGVFALLGARGGVVFPRRDEGAPTPTT